MQKFLTFILSRNEFFLTSRQCRPYLKKYFWMSFIVLHFNIVSYFMSLLLYTLCPYFMSLYPGMHLYNNMVFLINLYNNLYNNMLDHSFSSRNKFLRSEIILIF